MIKDTCISVAENLKERTKNPFLGTLIVVWIVHNWKLVYSLFHFDSKLPLEERINHIEGFFIKTPFYLNLLWVSVFTVLMLCVTYFFLGLSRFFSDFYNRVVIAEIARYFDKNSILRNKYLEEQEIARGVAAALEIERSNEADSEGER